MSTPPSNRSPGSDGPDHAPAAQDGAPLSLEHLLALKRAERPTPDFWSGFEQEFRRRQLAAGLRPEPWGPRLARRWADLRGSATRRALRALVWAIPAAAVLAVVTFSPIRTSPNPVLPPPSSTSAALALESSAVPAAAWSQPDFDPGPTLEDLPARFVHDIVTAQRPAQRFTTVAPTDTLRASPAVQAGYEFLTITSTAPAGSF